MTCTSTWLSAAAGAVLTFVWTGTSAAAPIDWTMWTSSTPGNALSNPGSAAGILGGGTVGYTGELENRFIGFPSWGPAGTFSGGTVGNPPPPSGGIIQLFGGRFGLTDTINFSGPVTNPVMAIWSLGQGGITASFQFTSSELFTIESGGPSNEFGGSSIFACGSNAVCGAEGNGTIQFSGTYTSLTWTNPVAEDWYGFAVGVPQSSTSVPEPSTAMLLAVGLITLGVAFGRRTDLGCRAAED